MWRIREVAQHQGFCSDFSFINLHAIYMAFNRMTLLEYLQISFKIIQGELCRSQQLTSWECYIKMLRSISIIWRHGCSINIVLHNVFQLSNFTLIEKWFRNVSLILQELTYTSAIKEKLIENWYQVTLTLKKIFVVNIFSPRRKTMQENKMHKAQSFSG